MTATLTTDQAAAQCAVDKLTQAVALLNEAATGMDQAPSVLCADQVAQHARAAAESADMALLMARNALNVAIRDAR
jgi:hypothetical protein